MSDLSEHGGLEQLISATEEYAREAFEGDSSGHDFEHTMRVRRMAERIAVEEGADLGIVALAALLHDVDDHKLSPETSEDLSNARAFLASHGVDGERAGAVLSAIREVSFSANGDSAPSSVEAACVRDADRLDAIGAVGIGRAFAYGGAHGRAMHSPDGSDDSTTVGHFRAKLLLLKDMMATDAGRRIAEHRDAVTREFLDEFLLEWEGRR